MVPQVCAQLTTGDNEDADLVAVAPGGPQTGNTHTHSVTHTHTHSNKGPKKKRKEDT